MNFWEDTGKFNAEHAVRRLPESIMTERMPSNRPPRLISTQSSVNLRSAFSGSSFYLAQSGMAQAQIEGVFTFYTGSGDPSLSFLGGIWKLKQRAQGRHSGGFKFTRQFHDHLWKRYISCLSGCTVIHNVQIVPEFFIRTRRSLNIGSVFFIDGTITEYFQNYAMFDLANIDPATMARAIEVERRAFEDADLVVTMGQRSADVLHSQYGLPWKKIAVIAPGANLAEEELTGYGASMASRDEFVLVFVGLYPERKGLQKIADAAAILRERGVPAVVRVIGKSLNSLSERPEIRHLGIISKANDSQRFINAIADAHFGCQLSTAELAGVALCEYLRLGVPIIGTDVGGTTDILKPGGSIIVPPDITANQLADILEPYTFDSAAYMKLRKAAAERQAWASWNRASQELDRALQTIGR